jgi:formylglycine-generating enzyme required for sulfatase activity
VARGGRARRAACLLLAAVAGACSSPELAPTWIEPVTGLELVLVPAGELAMGSEPDEPGREAQEARHVVRITRPFYLGRTEVTQAQWGRVLGSAPSSFTDCGDDCPVESVSWYDAQSFFSRLGELGSDGLRLPTEAEWEYACRAGTTTAFATGASLDDNQANIDQRDAHGRDRRGGGRHEEAVGRRPMPVASFAPNAWGFHDMHGNVWEWTADWHCPYANGEVSDPLGDCDSKLKVIRGGSWHYGADSARCALRYTHRPQDSGFSLGFRVARDVERPTRGR